MRRDREPSRRLPVLPGARGRHRRAAGSHHRPAGAPRAAPRASRPRSRAAPARGRRRRVPAAAPDPRQSRGPRASWPRSGSGGAPAPWSAATAPASPAAAGRRSPPIPRRAAAAPTVPTPPSSAVHAGSADAAVPMPRRPGPRARRRTSRGPPRAPPLPNRCSARHASPRCAVLDPTPAFELTRLEPPADVGEELDGMWRTLSWDGAQAEAGAPAAAHRRACRWCRCRSRAASRAPGR